MVTSKNAMEGIFRGYQMVPDDGFEPPTIRLQGGRSTN